MKAAMLASIVLTAAFGAAQNVQETNPENQIELQQKLGQHVPLDTKFKDENGKDVKIGDYFGKRPVLLVPVFYQCNGSCLLIKEGILRGLNALKEKLPGQHYELVVLSIHPKETPELAKAKREEWLKDFRYAKDGSQYVHFLTGEMKNIRKVTDSIGFIFKYNEDTNTIRHPAAVAVLTPEGRISSYLFGVTYPQRYIQADLDRAAKGEIGPPDPKPILWGCLQYDPRSGKTTLLVDNVLKVFGSLTALILFTWIFFMSIKHRRQPLYLQDGDGSKQGGVPKTQS